MPDRYNFERLKAKILELSHAANWEVAKREWSLTGVSEAEEPETCLCGHYPIIQLCTISNRASGKSVDVGNVCVKRFLGLRPDQIFQSLKRIRDDPDKGIGADAATFFFERGVINCFECKFSKGTLRKRNLSEKQLRIRRKINAKVLGSIRQRGVA